jgi:TPR repeat protein/membrane associated rhomboid family serine protease
MVFEHHQWWRLVAGPLMHGDLVHLVLNGVVLLFAGTIVELRLGRVRWLVVYGVSALTGALGSSLINDPAVVSIGASGAIMGLLAAMFVLAFREPDPSVRSALMINSLRMLVPSLLPLASGGHVTDLAAHAGGTVGGVLTTLLLVLEDRRFPRVLGALAAGLLVFTSAGVLLAAREAPAFLVMVDARSWRDARPALEATCTLGSGEACLQLGFGFIEADLAHALALLEPLCPKDRDGRACRTLGEALLRQAPPRRVEARPAFQRGCDLHDAEACFELGMLLDEEPSPDKATLRSLYTQACDGGVQAACANLAILIAADDPIRALSLASTACDLKEAGGCRVAAVWLVKSNGVAKDEPRARRLAERACTLGDASACTFAGALWSEGLGGPMDLTTTAGFYERACTGHDVPGCVHLAEMLATGDGVARDAERARTLFAQSCRVGNSRACDLLADATADDAQGALRETFDAACTAGAATACRWLGEFAEHGVGEERSPSLAAERYGHACELGDAEACAWRADLMPAEAAALRARACELGLETACAR